MITEIVERSAEIEVEEISNGFIVKYSGSDDRDNWVHSRVFVKSIRNVNRLLKEFYSLKLKD